MVELAAQPRHSWSGSIVRRRRDGGSMEISLTCILTLRTTAYVPLGHPAGA